MNVVFKGHSGYSSINTPTYLEGMEAINGSQFEYKTFITFGIAPPLSWELQKNQLGITWKHFIYYNEREIYHFASHSAYYIEDTPGPTPIHEIQELVTTTYKHLQDSFEKRRKEHNFFPSISALSSEAIDDTVRRLSLTLPDLPK